MSDDELPEYLRNFQGPLRDESNFGPEDVMWTDQDRIDPYDFVKELFSAQAALREVLLAIIRAHQRTDSSEAKRLDEALWALVGGGERRKGPKTRTSDGAVLIELARLQFLKKSGFADPDESFSDHLRRALKSHSGREFTRDDELDHAARALRKKYKKSEDALLSAISLSVEEEAQSFRAKVDTVLKALREIGIPSESPNWGPNWSK